MKCIAWRCVRRRVAGLSVMAGLLVAPPIAAAQSTPSQPAAQSPAPSSTSQAPSDPAPASQAPANPDDARFFDSVTVSATLNPATVKETPGTVSVIGADTIARRMIENAADLVAFEPGVYVETTVNRVGLNGFNIRGIGGNRVMMQVDGIETSEQFDFGPFNVHQFSLDLDSLKSAEIVRSAGSALYGSDALGGVVSFFTKDPRDYLPDNRRLHLAGKTLYDGRARDLGGNVVVAGGRPRLQASLFASFAAGSEPRNKGTIESSDVTRTALNPQDRRGVNALGKIVFTVADGNALRVAAEFTDQEIETQAYSLRAVTVAGPTTTNVADITSDDTMSRRRISVDQSLVNRAGLDQWSWNAFAQASDTAQVVDEVRVMTGGGPSLTVNRSGTLDYDQNTYGGAVQARKALMTGSGTVLLTAGGAYKRNVFDMIRDRLDVNAATGGIIPATNLILPSKYFPKSEVGEAGIYLQGEIKIGRLSLVPGVRYDRFDLDADQDDEVFIASLSPAAADFQADATSAKLGAAFALTSAVTLHSQYAGGFRAPPYSAVNSGFTNLQGGYTSIPNTDLDAETSDNVEVGVRAGTGPVSFGVTGFWNSYDDFILQVQRGVNPTTRLLEFQYQNVSKVDIRGVELQGEARLAPGLRLRAAYAVIRGDDVSGPVDVALNSIAPDQGVVGLQYSARSKRWGGDLMVRATHGQSQETAGTGFFAPDAYGVVDLFAWTELTRGVMLRGGALNLTNQKYFEWPNVRGRQASDVTLDRYSSPGTSGIVSLAYGW